MQAVLAADAPLAPDEEQPQEQVARREGPERDRVHRVRKESQHHCVQQARDAGEVQPEEYHQQGIHMQENAPAADQVIQLADREKQQQMGEEQQRDPAIVAHGAASSRGRRRISTATSRTLCRRGSSITLPLWNKPSGDGSRL